MNPKGMDEAMKSLLQQIQALVESKDCIVFWADGGIRAEITCAELPNGKIWISKHPQTVVDVSAYSVTYVKGCIKVFKETDHDWVV